jgi:O-antigen ligase
MIDYLKKNIQFVVMVMLWIISGMYGGPLYYLIVPASILLLRMKNRNAELIFGLIIVTVLSDHWEPHLLWASNVKDIYLLLMTAMFVFNSRDFKYQNMVVAPFLFYFIWSFISLMRSPDFFISFQKTISTILFYSIVPIYIMKSLVEERDHFLRGAVLTTTALLAYGLFMAILWPETAYLMGRFRGVTGNPNSLGIICTVFFGLYTIIQLHYRHLFLKWESGVIYGIILLSVILSGSRNAIFAILIFYLFGRFFSVSYLLGFTALIVLAVAYQILISNLPAILTALGLQEYMRVENIDDGSSRLIAWQFTLKHLKKDFLLGHGIGYEVYFFQNYGADLFFKYHVGNTHNSWLALWLNTGIIGLILYAGGLIYRFMSFSSRSPYVMPFMYSIMFSATFESWLAGVLSPYILLMLISLSVISQLQPVEAMNKEEQKEFQNDTVAAARI